MKNGRFITRLKKHITLNIILAFVLDHELALPNFCATVSFAVHYLYVLNKVILQKRNQLIPDMIGEQLEVVNTLQQ